MDSEPPKKIYKMSTYAGCDERSVSKWSLIRAKKKQDQSSECTTASISKSEYEYMTMGNDIGNSENMETASALVESELSEESECLDESGYSEESDDMEESEDTEESDYMEDSDRAEDSDCLEELDNLSKHNFTVDELLAFTEDLNNITIPNKNTSFTADQRIMFRDSDLTVSDVMLMLQSINIRFGTTRALQNALLDFIKALAGPKFNSWNFSPYVMSKTVAPPKNTLKKIYYCHDCHIKLGDILLSQKKSVPLRCSSCDVTYEVTKDLDSYIISLDLKYQLQNLVNRRDIQESIEQNNTRLSNVDEGTINDVTDGELFKLHVRDPGALSLNFSLDGAQLFKSAKKSFWPLQANLNCLFGKKRFKHPLIVALWQTEKEPAPAMLNLILSIEQCNDINSKGGLQIIDVNTGQIYSKPVVLYCACVDSVARPIMQNRLQFNGYYGCSYCYQYGFYKEGCVRYPISDQMDNLRNHETHLRDLSELNESRKLSINGVKGESALLSIEHFDIVWNLPPDYMHNALMGVTKQLTLHWKKIIPKDKYKKLIGRMSHVKLSKDLRRSLRTLEFTTKYKALEWKTWLLFGSVPCLFKILDDSMFKSYLLFVNSIFTLLKSEITQEEVNDCEYDLIRFVGECELNYTVKFMTYNVHMLIHYCSSIRKCGPLWGNSAFPFESAIGKFIKEINAPNGCCKQISNNWMRRCTFETHVQNNTSNSRTAIEYSKSLIQNKTYLHNVSRVGDVTLLGIGTYNDEVQSMMREFTKNYTGEYTYVTYVPNTYETH
ncbi:hypothetical protein TKK_0010219 [Trichogramma kaykai]